MNNYIIDRKTAQQLFQDLLHAQHSCCLLRFQGHGKMGKTHLLKLFHRKTIMQKIPSAYDQLEENYTNVSSVLEALKQQFGGANKFPEYQRVVAKHSESTVKVDMKDIRIKDHSNFSLYQAGEDVHTNQMRHTELTDAFLSDLEKLEKRKQKLLLFDALDRSDEQIRGWVQGHLIVGLHRIDKVLVVLAGREKPTLNPPWEYDCVSHELKPVTIEDYLEFCEQMKSSLGQEAIEVLHSIYGGNPGQFSEILPTLKHINKGV